MTSIPEYDPANPTAGYNSSSETSAMSAEEAAGFWVPFHTGYVGVIQRAQLQPDETMLVLGGAGSSGSAAIQLGKAVGAQVIATVSSQEKAEFWRGVSNAPSDAFGSLRHRFRELNLRLERMEAYVTSKEFEIDRELGREK